MKILQSSPYKLSIELDLDCPHAGMLIATLILWGLWVQQVLARDILTRNWQSFEVWDLVVLLFPLVPASVTWELFNQETIESCVFDKKIGKVAFRKRKFLGKPFTSQMPLKAIQNVRPHKEYGDNNDYYYIGIDYSVAGKQKTLILKKRSEDQEVTQGRIAEIRSFLKDFLSL